MRKITAPIPFDDRGEETANLQQALEALGFPIASTREKHDRHYGSSTARVVADFKSRYELPDSEPDRVDRPTADKINEMLAARGLLDDEDRFSVRGQVAEPNGAGIGDRIVRIYDKCLGKENPLGRGRTDANGNYLIKYQAEHLSHPPREQADLLVRIFSRSGEQQAASPLIINALSHEIVNLVIGEEPYRGRDLYSRLHHRLAEYLEGVALDEIETRDLYCLAVKIEINIEQLYHYVRARQWEAQWEKLPAEVFFAWFQRGMPPTWTSLLGRSLDELKAAIEQAVEENLIPRTAMAYQDKLEPILIEWRSDNLVTAGDRPMSRASLGQLLEASRLTQDQRRKMLLQWQTYEGEAAEFWEAQQEQLGEDVSRDFDLTLQLGALTRNHLPLIRLLKEQNNVRQFSDVARIRQADWLRLLEESDLEIPADIQGDDAASQRQSYAEALNGFTERLLPTRVLAEAFTRDAEIDSQQMDLFFRKNPDFEFQKQSIRSYLKEKPDALADTADPKAAQLELEALQRVFHLSPARDRWAAAKILWQNQLHSAWAVTMRGEQELTELFGGEQTMAKLIMKQAESAQQVSQAALLQYLDHKYSFGYVMPQRKADIEGIPDFESLFGGQGYCECQHCRSCFSPSAYLVDLFLYLKKAKLKPAAASPPVDTVLEKLFERRPDLANLELDCENSHTVLPYIDLVHEILENAVSARSYDQKNLFILGKQFTLPVAKTSQPVPQTEADPDTLKAFPQHLNPAAYEILRTGDQAQGVFYPWSLPFNLWAVEVRTYLEHLEVPRWQLMESILGPQANALAIAADYLGLIPEEKEILVDDDPSDGRLKQYWGISGALTHLGEEVEAFLKQSGFSYAELQQLLALRYVQEADPNQDLRIQYEDPSSCQVADARLENLTNNALNRIHRLGRLQGKLDENYIPLDQTIMGLGGEINDEFIQDLADLLRIEQALPRKVRRTELLCWWSLLDTHDYPHQDSLYRSLFLNPGISQPVEAEFMLNDSATELKKVSENQATALDLAAPGLNPDLQAQILGALRWRLPELKAAVADAWGGSSFTLNLANLSYLYRVAGLCRVLRIGVQEYVAAKAVLGMASLPGPDEIGTVRPQDTCRFIRHLQLIRDVDLDPETLDYLLRHQFRLDAPFVLGENDLGRILFELQTQLNKLLQEAVPEGISLRDKLQIKLARILPPEDVTTTLQILEEDPALTLSGPEKKYFLDQKLAFFPEPAAAKAKLVDGGLSDPADRYDYMLAALGPYLVENLVVQLLADSVRIATELADALLRAYLPHPSNPNLPAIHAFFAPDFLEAPIESGWSGAAFPDQANVIARMQKIGLLIERLEVDTVAVKFIMQQGSGVGLPDLAQIPLAPVSSDLPAGAFDSWNLLLKLVRIDRRQFKGNTSVFDVLSHAHDPNRTRADLLEGLGQGAGWDLNDLDYLTGPSGLNLAYPADYRDAAWLVPLAAILPMVVRAGVSAPQMAQWTGLEVNQAQANSVRHAVKAKYGNKRWLDRTTSLRERIREQQRDALLGFALHHRQKHDQTPFEDVDDLYAYYLTDPQMNACAMTSRTVLATSSVQLFVQRILMNLETGMTFSRQHAREWQWRKQYRVWEANRKVFFWPENWIEPELRDNKTPFFRELETELLQDELNEHSIERAYVNYLHKLNEVARLDICGVHYESEVRSLHIFARTPGLPSVYYYRRWENRQEWTPWEKVELDIYNAEGVQEPQPGVSLLPVVHNRRLFLFWPIFTLQKDKPNKEDKEKISNLETQIDDLEKQIQDYYNEITTIERDLKKEIAVLILNTDNKELIKEKTKKAKEEIYDIKDETKKLEQDLAGKKRSLEALQNKNYFYQVNMAYADYRQGHWSAKKLTNGALRTPYFEQEFAHGENIRSYFFYPLKTGAEGELRINWYYTKGTTYYRLNSYFEYDSCKSEMVPVNKKSFQKMNKELPDYMEYNKAKDDAKSTKVPLRVVNAGNEVDLLLKKAEKSHLMSFSMDRGVFKHTTPFIYQDSRRSFLVIPPLPERRFAVAGAIGLASRVMSGKAGSLGAAAFKRVLKPDPEPQAVKPAVRLIGSKTNRQAFFQADQAARVMIRPPARSGLTVEQDQSLVGGLTELAAAGDIAVGVSYSPFPGRMKFKAMGEYVLRPFYHPYVCLFLKQLNRYGIDGLLNPNPKTKDGRALARQLTPDHAKKFDFGKQYGPNWFEVNRFAQPREIISFDYEDAYAAYNRELFFHIPLFIATRLHQDQRFEAAQKWLHYIFDPTETEGDAPYRFWKIKPFHSYTSSQMEADIKMLLQGKAQSQILAWQKDPFNPHLLARFRRLAYMKTTVMKYLDNLIAWGDYLFHQDSIESINEATQLYVLAGQILGKLPVQTEAKNIEAKTFSQLAGQLDALGNAWLEIELGQQGGNAQTSSADSASHGHPELIPYFCCPPNAKLLAYWDTVADRLFKIRNCMNIEGMVRQLPLFQPPIDPALLVRAAAMGMDLSSAVNELYAPMPHYRFEVMIQKAQEMCQELKSLGGALLSALEKKDAEALTLLRTRQETALLEASREIQAKQIDESEHQLAALDEQRKLSEMRYEEYRARDFISPGEGAAIALSIGAGVTRAVSGALSAGAGAAKLFPDYTIGAHAQGMASGMSSSAHIAGGQKTGGGLDSAAKALEVISIVLREAANTTSTFAQYGRRQEDWDLQRDLAKQEMKQLDQLILAAEIRLALAEKSKRNLELQISHSKTVADFMEKKFTRQQLYGWMTGQLASVYFQTYQLAYDIAKQAEKAFRHEIGIQDSNYIQFGYWDNLKKGLLTGEKLHLDLKRLETAYYEKNRREYELTRHISLRQLNPIALLALKATGTCELTLPEWLFDIDNPGHYMRRIKSVSLSIPAVTGPYTSVSCTLSLLKSSLRRSPVLKNDAYARADNEEDARFVDDYGTVQSIVTSSAQNDSGMFDTNLRDARYLPFEGKGLIDSTWKLELPTDFRGFDYDTISDVILHVHYLSRQGGGQLRNKAKDHLHELFEDVSTSGLMQLFSLRHDFPTEWNRFVTGQEDFKATIRKDYLPYFVQNADIEINQVEIYAVQDQAVQSKDADGLNLGSLNDALNDDGEFELSLAEDQIIPRDHDAQVFLILRYNI